ncbi:hypothetical protein PHLCEN_2v3965 [Hermanssonia centrifuga]|uniref:Uncharacterized protein n=1 Tax=Hermanssonia centrifuga TaxID=98765 RepID=A0A2R6Q7H5_9APHY|nr:hypothetical protein PHLCEN_2v3965 [Hermanssonia centrifuga]
MIVGTHLSSYRLLLQRLLQMRTVTLEGLQAKVLGDQGGDWGALSFLTEETSAHLQSFSFDPALFVNFYEWFFPKYLRVMAYLFQHVTTLSSLRTFTLQTEIPTTEGLVLSRIEPKLAAAEDAPYEDVRPQINVWSRDGFDWSFLRTAFGDLSELETVTFVACSSRFYVGQETEFKAIRKELPGLEARGILRYEFIESHDGVNGIHLP